MPDKPIDNPGSNYSDEIIMTNSNSYLLQPAGTNIPLALSKQTG